MSLHIEPLAPHQQRARFRCGEPEIDVWFRRRAPVDGLFVACDDDDVLGFYSLSPIVFAADSEPDRPIALITHLARDRRARGQKLGEVLLADALARVLDHAPNTFAFAADAPTEPARTFYGRFGFTCQPTQPSRMILLASTAARARNA